MRNFSTTYPMFLFRRAGQSVTSLRPQPAAPHMSHRSHTLFSPGLSQAEAKTNLFSNVFELFCSITSFSADDPASHFHRPHSTGLGLFRLLLFTLCFGSWMSRLTPGGHSFLLTRKILSFERLGSIQQCYPKVLGK